jgi:hypothetical protein
MVAPMPEPEYRRAQEYILDADVFRGDDRMTAYGLSHLAFGYAYPGRPAGKQPVPAAFSLTAAEAAAVAERVDSIVIELRDPGFDSPPTE